MASTKTLANLRSRTRDLADMVTSTPADHFVQDAELDRAINASLKALYNKLIIARGDDYYVVIDSQATVAGQENYPLPSDFYQLVGIHASSDATGSDITDLPRFEHHERAELVRFQAGGGGSHPTHWRYRLKPSDVELRPAPTFAGGVLQLHYIPAFVELVNSGDTFDGVNGWEEWACYTAAIDLLNREESDPSQLMAARALIDAQIDALAGQRDAANAPRVVDTRGDGWDRRRDWLRWL